MGQPTAEKQRVVFLLPLQPSNYSNMTRLLFNTTANSDITEECFDNFVKPLFDSRPDTNTTEEEWLTDFLTNNGLYVCARWEAKFFKDRGDLYKAQADALATRVKVLQADADYFRGIALYWKERATIEK